MSVRRSRQAHDQWYVLHFDHDNNLIDMFYPMNTSFTKRQKEAGEISYDISLSERTMRWAIVGPKRTYFELWNNDYGEPIISGIHSYINTKRGEEVLHVQGKTWLWYFQNRHYPFNPLLPNAFLGGNAADDQGIAYQNYDEPGVILEDIWDTISSRPHSDFGINISTFGLGYKVHHRVELADTRSFFDMWTELSEIEPGFNFFDTPDRYVNMADGKDYLNYARQAPENCIHVFDRYKPPTDIVDIEFENSGPEGTHILGLGAGTGTRLGRAYGYEQSQAQFGRWDMTVEFPDIMDKDDMVSQTQAHFSRGLYPLHNLPMVVKPDDIDGFWNRFFPGQAIWVKENFESNHVDGASQIIELRAKIDNQGGATVELDLEEVNEQGRPGSVQG